MPEKRVYSYDILKEVFEEKGCVLSTTVEEYLELRKEKKIPKVSFIASCGHPNTVFVNVFIHRHTGVVCKDCIGKQYKTRFKTRENYIEREHIGFLKIKELVETELEVVQLAAGCTADFAVRPRGSVVNEWLAIQLKTTTVDKLNMYSFTLHRTYPNCIILLSQLDKELFWMMDGNTTPIRKINIGRKKSKYDCYSVGKELLSRKLLEIFTTYVKHSLESLNIPCAPYMQREAEYRKLREEKVPLEYEYPSFEGTVYDFCYKGQRIQEKVVNDKLVKGSYYVGLCKNNGIGADGKRKFQLYILGDNAFYWFHMQDKEHFYIIPEQELFKRGFIAEKLNQRSKTFYVNPYKTEGYSHGWANTYLYKYSNIDIEQIKTLLTA